MREKRKLKHIELREESGEKVTVNEAANELVML